MDGPLFFVPGASPADQEEVYAKLAMRCHRPVPRTPRRVYSITYLADGEEWVATVGRTLHGTVRLPKRARRIKRRLPVADPATVLAIFPGTPFLVVTNKGIVEGVQSSKENPFVAEHPKRLTYFSSAWGAMVRR